MLSQLWNSWLASLEVCDWLQLLHANLYCSMLIYQSQLQFYIVIDLVYVDLSCSLYYFGHFKNCGLNYWYTDYRGLWWCGPLMSSVIAKALKVFNKVFNESTSLLLLWSWLWVDSTRADDAWVQSWRYLSVVCFGAVSTVAIAFIDFM